MIETRLLQYFLAIAEKQSITKAAENEQSITGDVYISC